MRRRTGGDDQIECRRGDVGQLYVDLDLLDDDEEELTRGLAFDGVDGQEQAGDESEQDAGREEDADVEAAAVKLVGCRVSRACVAPQTAPRVERRAARVGEGGGYLERVQ